MAGNVWVPYTSREEKSYIAFEEGLPAHLYESHKQSRCVYHTRDVTSIVSLGLFRSLNRKPSSFTRFALTVNPVGKSIHWYELPCVDSPFLTIEKDLKTESGRHKRNTKVRSFLFCVCFSPSFFLFHFFFKTLALTWRIRDRKVTI